MASVTHRLLRDGSIRWRVQARHEGKMREVTMEHEKGAFELKALIEKTNWQTAMTVLKARQKAGVNNIPTLREWVDRYLSPESGLLTGVEDATRSGYRQAAERSFLQILGDIPVDAITKADVGRWVSWQEQQPSSRGTGTVAMKTVQNYHSILSAALRAAVEAKLREDNPAWRTRITRGQKREGVFLSPEEFATLLHFIPERHTGLVMFLAGTGCRWGEATAVTWRDVDLRADPPTVRIDKAWKKAPKGGVILKQPKSKRSRRTVSLTHDTAAVLGTPGKPDALVFPNTVGTHLWHSKFRETVWVLAVRKAQDANLCSAEGLRPITKTPTIHDLRHSHASWLIADGIPLPFVQARLGHESINTTVGVYGHLQPDAHAQMSAAIARTLSTVRPLRAVESA